MARSVIGVVLVLAVVAVVIGWLVVSSAETSRSVPYSTGYAWIRDNKVASATLGERVLNGVLAASETVDGRPTTAFRTTLPERDDTLLPLLRDHVHSIEIAPATSSGGGGFLLVMLPWVLVFGAWWWITQRRGAFVGSGALAGFLSRGRRFEPSPTSTKLDDVAGLVNAKRDLAEVVAFLHDPARFEKLGGRIPRGLLMLGPPGTGKTLLARATAGEAGVPFFSISGSEFIELYVGVGAGRVRDLFATAKQGAPSIIFIDEIDAIGRTRGAGLGSGHDERDQTLDQLLSEMDGFDRHDLVVVIAATNRPDVLDPALLRPGRFDRRIVVDLPEVGARRAILGVHVRGKPIASDVDLDQLAEVTPGFSGADLANLVNEAALQAARRNAEAISRDDVIAARDKIVLGDPREGKLTSDEKRRVAVHEAGHAVVAWASSDAEPPRRISILPRGRALGATEQAPGSDRHLATRGELDTKLTVLLGGFAAELAVLGEVSSGSEQDLREATALATEMVSRYGMSDALGPMWLDRSEGPWSRPSDAMIHAIEDQARELLAAAHRRAVTLVEKHRPTLDRLADRLVDQETLEHDELAQTLGARPMPALALG